MRVYPTVSPILVDELRNQPRKATPGISDFYKLRHGFIHSLAPFVPFGAFRLMPELQLPTL